MGFKKITRFFAAVSLAMVFTLSMDSAVIDAYAVTSDDQGTVVVNLNSEGQKNIVHSSSFEVKSGQMLTLEIKSSIKGSVDLFLFSPSGEEQHITIGGSDETKTVNLSEGRWSYNCTGFFDSGTISILGTLSSVDPAEGEEKPTPPDLTPTDGTDLGLNNTIVMSLSNEGKTSIIHSSSFEAKSGQILTLEIKSSIKGSADLFLFSPSGENQYIKIGGSDETKTVNLSEGRWSYNCTGFFDSGSISITGTINSEKNSEAITTSIDGNPELQ